jgi:hypothetical protein
MCWSLVKFDYRANSNLDFQYTQMYALTRIRWTVTGTGPMLLALSPETTDGENKGQMMVKRTSIFVGLMNA